jgi:uncharacterized alkaline shock family protein YloU
VTEYLIAEEGPGVRFAIARAAVEAVVAHAALAVPGALGVPGLMSRLPGRRPVPRVQVSVRSQRLFVGVGLAVRHGTVIPELGRAVQESVAAAAGRATGLPVAAVDVRVEAVEPR